MANSLGERFPNPHPIGPVEIRRVTVRGLSSYRTNDAMSDENPAVPAAPTWSVNARRPQVALVGMGDQQRVRNEAERLEPVIKQHADVRFVDFEGTRALPTTETDLVIVLGGDGSILRAASLMANDQLPVLSVNLGKLGFLSALSPDEFVDWFPRVCAGECRILDYLMFSCEVVRDNVSILRQLGLNETAILGGSPFSILDVDLFVDSDWATTFSGDGLIISTPIGSTAHSLSAGGPLLRQDLNAFVISAISPHTLTVRPVVDSSDRVYELVVPRPNEATSVVVDGRVVCRLSPNDRIRVQRAEARFQMIEIPEKSYYRTLRERLDWGGRLSKLQS